MMQIKDKSKVKKEIKDWVKTIVIALVVVVILNKSVIVNATVPSASMATTISIGDRLIVNRLAYMTKEPQRGDIITFKFYEEATEKLYVKRLIGLPGDTVEIISGVVYINGEILEETYLDDDTDKRTFGPYIVPQESFFFLGDNRLHSKDSRLWNDPYINKADIVGKVLFRYFPSFDIVE